MARLDPTARGLLRTYRVAKTRQHTSEETDPVWSRIEASLDEGAVLNELDPAPNSRPAWVVPVVVATAVAAVMVAALSLQPRTPAGTNPSSLEQASNEALPNESAGVASRSPPRTNASAATPAKRAPPAPRVEPPLQQTAPPRVRRNRASSSPPAARTPSPSSGSPAEQVLDALQAEMLLIAQARRALRAGTPTRALALLKTHATTFPRGQMQEDRRVLRIEALCAAGKGAQGRGEVVSFLRDFPDSAHAARVRSICPTP